LGNGLAPHADPPTAWNETNHVKWKVKVPGRGSATPIVWDDRVFVQTAIPSGKLVEAPPTETPPAAARPAGEPDARSGPPPERRSRGPGGFGGPGGRGMGAAKPTEVYQFVVLCLDRATGKPLWQQVAREEVPHEAHHRSDGTFASSSPVTDGRHLFAYFGSRGLHCYDWNGQLKWSQDLGDLRIAMSFGEGSSPALHQDTLIVNWDHEGDSFITALDKHTGQTRWKKSREERTSWATPLVIEHEGKTQVIVPATGKIRSYDLATGDVIWECGGMTANVIPSPVVGHGMAYCLSGFRGSALVALRLGGKGDLEGTDSIVWRHNKNTPYVPSPLLLGDRLYFFSGNNGMLSCFEAKTGRPLIDAERLEALQGVYASPVAAAGRVYLQGRNGATVVLKDADKLEILATNSIDEKTDASPVIVDRELFLRGKESLYCIAEQ
jgi:outer membrane protein assembly factor BamB